VQGLRSAAESEKDFDLLIQDVDKDFSIMLFVARQDAASILNAFDLNPEKNAVSGSMVEFICRWYSENNRELPFRDTLFFTVGGQKMALKHHRPFPLRPALLQLIMQHLRRY